MDKPVVKFDPRYGVMSSKWAYKSYDVMALNHPIKGHKAVTTSVVLSEIVENGVIVKFETLNTIYVAEGSKYDK